MALGQRMGNADERARALKIRPVSSLFRSAILVALKELRALLAGGKILYRYSVMVLGTACATTIPTTTIARRVVKCRAVTGNLVMLGHLLLRYLAFFLSSSVLIFIVSAVHHLKTKR